MLRHTFHRSNKRGFNPYFTGSNSGRILLLHNVTITPSFNPYFTGSNSGRFYFVYFFHNVNFVSILILLEVILEVTLGLRMIQPLWCFNPYFTGSNSGSLWLYSVLRSFPSFNPYFTGSNSGSISIPNISYTNNTFQSLFYWK